MEKNDIFSDLLELTNRTLNRFLEIFVFSKTYASMLSSIKSIWGSFSKNYDGLYFQGTERVLFGDCLLNSDRFRCRVLNPSADKF